MRLKFISTTLWRRWHMRRAVFLVLLLGTAVGDCWAQDVSGKCDYPNGIPFEVNRSFGAILIRAQVNGHPVTLVVDTGASHTILSAELLQVRSLALEHARTPAKGSGLVGTAGWARATIEIGAITWQDRQVLVMDDFQDLSNNLKQKVDGIIGEDVLREFDFVALDFKRHRLVLLR